MEIVRRYYDNEIWKAGPDELVVFRDMEMLVRHLEASSSGRLYGFDDEMRRRATVLNSKTHFYTPIGKRGGRYRHHKRSDVVGVPATEGHLLGLHWYICMGYRPGLHPLMLLALQAEV